MKKVLKIIGYIIISILVLIAILIGIVFIQTKTNPDKVPTIFGYKPFIVLSGSMETEIYKGDLVIVKEVKHNKLKLNDVIAFRDEDNYVVTHRIVDINKENNETKYITKGDNNNTNDRGYVTIENIEGIYVNKIKGFGNILLIMQKKITLIITLALIVIIGTIYIIFDSSKLSNSERKELEEYRKKQGKKD